jgi:hypothetical protein
MLVLIDGTKASALSRAEETLPDKFPTVQSV